MNKRTERNQNIYKEIEEQVRNKEERADNSTFENVENDLHAVNPNLFQGKKEKPIKNKKKINHSLLIRIIVFLLIVSTVLFIWMVIR